ncbi:MAG: F0F1 ATP synthase subunit delta [Patescibacteria group bacterium]
MDKKTIKNLAQKSFKGNTLDQSKVKKIYPLLKRAGLKEYIRQLKKLSDKNNVFLTLPSDSELSADAIKIFSKTFPGKNIKIAIDPSLIGGVRIKHSDTIYELSIRDQLEEVLKSVTEYENW